MQEENKYVGIRLKIERKRLGYILDNAQSLCAVTNKTFGRWESGKPIPSDKLLMLSELGFDIYYILTGGRISSQLDTPENNDITAIIIDESMPYSDLKQEKLSGNAVPSSVGLVGTVSEKKAQRYENLTPNEVAELGKRFFDAWSNVFHTHGTEMQTVIMSALKGSEIAHIMVSEQFKEEAKKHRKREVTKTLDESKKG